MTAQAPHQRDTVRGLLRELWREKLQPSRPGTGRETPTGRLIHGALFATAALTACVTVGIVLVLVFETVEFFREIPLLEFFGSVQWSPLFADKQFGVWALVWGTVIVALMALAIAVPLGLLAAIYLSEFARPRVRATLKPLLEVLAGVPTVVYGYFALPHRESDHARNLRRRRRHLQRAQRRGCAGDHDHPDDLVVERGRHERRPALTA